MKPTAAPPTNPLSAPGVTVNRDGDKPTVDPTMTSPQYPKPSKAPLETRRAVPPRPQDSGMERSMADLADKLHPVKHIRGTVI